MTNTDLIAEINELRQKKNAVILAHYYQTPEIQDIADFIGDSLALSQEVSKVKADIIVFAGVHFMAETAKILNPTKKVLIPDLEASCSLAESCSGKDLEEFKKKYPDHIVVSYINCSAEVKCHSDIICTSGNALKIINSLPKEEKIIFAPDKNLGAYINNKTGRNMVLWNGTCTIHDMLEAENILKLIDKYPNHKVIAHPECNPAVLLLADFVGSTAAMLNYVKADSSQAYLVATETGIIHQMSKIAPNKEFIVVSNDNKCACNDCKYMKLNTLEKIRNCLRDENPEIIISKKIIERAKAPIERMLKMS